jgi:hypothetical protein
LNPQARDSVRRCDSASYGSADNLKTVSTADTDRLTVDDFWQPFGIGSGGRVASRAGLVGGVDAPRAVAPILRRTKLFARHGRPHLPDRLTPLRPSPAVSINLFPPRRAQRRCRCRPSDRQNSQIAALTAPGREREPREADGALARETRVTAPLVAAVEQVTRGRFIGASGDRAGERRSSSSGVHSSGRANAGALSATQRRRRLVRVGGTIGIPRRSRDIARIASRRPDLAHRQPTPLGQRTRGARAAKMLENAHDTN